MSMSRATDLNGRAFHLIGVGGAGMSVLAQLLAERGAQRPLDVRAQRAGCGVHEKNTAGIGTTHNRPPPSWFESRLPQRSRSAPDAVA